MNYLLKITSRLRILFVTLWILSLSQVSHSADTPKITEILYDPIGTDSGREWLEVYLPNDSGVITEYLLRENGIDHTIRSFEGYSTTESGQYVVIADNPEKFLEDFPEYKGGLYDSAFSLRNTGESLEIVNGADVVIFSHQYLPMEGEYTSSVSLHLDSKDEVWKVAKPSPGEGSIILVSSIDSLSESTVIQDEDMFSGKKNTHSLRGDEILGSINVVQNISGIVGVPIFFKIFSEKDRTKLLERMKWSYGDGNSEITNRPQNTYYFPGEYLAVGILDEGEQNEQVVYAKILVVDKPITLDASSISEGYIEVLNTSQSPVNIGSFKIVIDDKWAYKLSDNTFVLGENSIKIPLHVISSFNRDIDYQNTNKVVLEYPDQKK